ncbi:MAG: HAMP domain-containing sensor histidine kinase [Lutisporaceae bacterium]
MDIKLKNARYSIVTKTIAVILVWLCFVSAVMSGVYLIDNQHIIKSESYYETSGFKSEFYSLVYNAIELKMKQNIKYVIKDRISNSVNFAYYIKNSHTGESNTNINVTNRIDLLNKQASYVHISEYMIDSKSEIYFENIREMLSGTSFEVHAAVVEPLKRGDVFYDSYEHYSKVKLNSIYLIILFIASTVLMLIAFIYLLYSAGRRKESEDIILIPIDRIYTDVHTLLIFMAVPLSLIIAVEIPTGFISNSVHVFEAIALSICVLIGLSYVLSMTRQIKKRQIFTNSFIYKLYGMTSKFALLGFNNKVFKAWILLLLLGYGIVNGALFSIFILTGLEVDGFFTFLVGLLLLGFNIEVIYLVLKNLKSLSKIMEAAKELSSGNLEYTLDSKDMSLAFVGLAEDLQGIQSGLKEAVAEAVKGERMKTELITNVSHDLKTPLTSIINYVDLLKKEDLDNQNAKEYIKVLEEKSARLKQLVEDLIEASKATSGNLSVNTEKVDMHQLVMQADGEYQEKIEKANLDIRTSISEKEVYVLADGKHLWRIVENLLSNALKYSMPNSRVYISIDKDEQYGILTIKNMSAYPLEISSEQLTERFVRGDASRTTEGSGLGLSIAQGLTNLQGGKFKIDIDGDLFKVTIEIPLWKEILAI